MPTDSRQQLRTIWAYRWWVALFVAAVTLAAYFLSKRQPVKYDATALVQVISASQAAGQYEPADAQQSLINTLVRYAQTPAVYQAGAQAAGSGQGWQAFRDATSVNPETGSAILDLQATARKPATAALYANAYATAFSSFVQQYESTQSGQTLRRIQDQIDQSTAAAAIPGQASIHTAQLRNEAAALRAKLASAVAAPTDSVQVLGSALPPTSPSSPHPKRNAILAFIVALVLGVGIAFGASAVADRYRDADEVANDLGLTLLGEVPRATRQEGPTIEAFRRVRTAVLLALEDHRARSPSRGTENGPAGRRAGATILVAAAEGAVGKSYTTAGLARAFAADGWRVLAVDGDLRKPSLHAQLDVSPTPGLVDALAGPGNVAHLPQLARQTTSQPGSLEVIAAGRAGPNSTELLSSPGMAQALRSFREGHDYLVMDSPPLLPVVDAVVLAGYADGVVVVVDARRSRRRDVQRAVQTLRATNAAVLGFVYNRAKLNTRIYGYDYVSMPATSPRPRETELTP